MAILGWFSKRDGDDFERILDTLTTSIATRRNRLEELTARERRASSFVTFYTILAWALYLCLWWLALLPDLLKERTRSNIELEKVLRALPIVLGPFILKLLRRILTFWYKRKESAEERTLKELVAKRERVIEDLKQKNNYYSTKSLIDRYGSSSSIHDSDLSQQKHGPLKRPPKEQLKAAKSLSPVLSPSPQSDKSPRPAGPQQSSQPSGTPQRDIAASPQRQWYDKLADALLGMDERTEPDSVGGKFALICRNCGSHNGLVPESLREQTRYTCPRCGFYNHYSEGDASSGAVAFPSSSSDYGGEDAFRATLPPDAAQVSRGRNSVRLSTIARVPLPRSVSPNRSFEPQRPLDESYNSGT